MLLRQYFSCRQLLREIGSSTCHRSPELQPLPGCAIYVFTCFCGSVCLAPVQAEGYRGWKIDNRGLFKVLRSECECATMQGML